MTSLEKRINRIEQQESHKKRPKPYIAIVNTDGKVNVSHADEDDFQLPNEKAFQSWADDNNLDNSEHLEVIFVKPQGKEPDVKTWG